tara:strand:+ start:304 stop:519 length:216 start_codon:yes stop_codon:yes gene_type:complete
MKKFTINMIEKHYAKFEVEAVDMDDARDILMFGVNAELEPLTDVIVRIDTRQDYENVDVVTEFYDDEWNEL